MTALVPRLERVKLVGYDPIFVDPVEFDIDNNLFIILGGNGLGKTTILQSVIFGIAGPSDDNIEPIFKERRWDRSYFRDRLNNANNASIEVSFRMGDRLVTLKRTFNSDRIQEFVLDDEVISSDKQQADKEFESFLNEYCGYNNLDDFAFIIHKLCYLSEKRENLAWDLDAQTRILMQILTDNQMENNFRDGRATVKRFDSAIRHKNVHINGLEKRIQKLRNDHLTELLEIPRDELLNIPIDTVIIPQLQDRFEQSDLDQLQMEILSVNGQLITKQKDCNDLRFKHSKVVAEIEMLRDELSKYEHAFFLEQLNKFESNEAKLAIYKLIHHHLCPACGNRSDELYNQAVEFLKGNRCPICGTEEVMEPTSINPATEAELAEKLRSKIDLEKIIIQLEKEIARLNDEYSHRTLTLNKHILNRKSAVVFIEKGDEKLRETESVDQLQLALNALVLERNEMDIQKGTLQLNLDEQYQQFNSRNNERIEKMMGYYSKYASEFLGIDCGLIPIDSEDNFLNLKLYVPIFNDKPRKSPDSCSEAQRFFLDIAFRMALIDLVNELGNFKGTFICETPENALDITYINNVAEMFDLFAWQHKHTLLLTSNIQVEGIAQNLLFRVKGRKKKQNSFLNLIDIGNLSEVQASPYGQALLQQQIKKMLKD